MKARTLPTDSTARKTYPVATGVLDYFPDALVALARLSDQGNEQHNPGQPLHWAREKSKDHPDTLIRHFLERGTADTDGMRHSAKMAWRALAILQLEIESDLEKKEVPFFHFTRYEKLSVSRNLLDCEERRNRRIGKIDRRIINVPCPRIGWSPYLRNNCGSRTFLSFGRRRHDKDVSGWHPSPSMVGAKGKK